MTILACSNGFVQLGKHRVNVTTRLDAENVAKLGELTMTTINMWMYLAGKIEAGAREITLPEGQPATPELKLGIEDLYIEPRVTVWGDILPGHSLTVHSDTHPMAALILFWARYDAIQAAIEKYTPEQPQQQPPTMQQPRRVGDEPPMVENAKAAKAHIGQTVKMEICAVSKVFTPKGAAEYQLFGRYGAAGMVGKFPELRVYADNEAAINQGVVGLLDSLNLKPGDAPSAYALIATVKVSAKGEKVNLYVNALQTPDGSKHSDAYKPQGNTVTKSKGVGMVIDSDADPGNYDDEDF